MRALDAPVLDHLAREREWYDIATGHLGPLVQALRAEMTDRVPATDSSVSWPQHGYSYYTVTPAGREYDQLLRRSNRDPELLLDVNELVGDSDYVDLGLWSVSPDTSLMAYSVDFDGDEVYELRFRDLATGADLEDVVPRTAPGGAWSADSAYFFYLVHDESWRQHQVWRHRLGTPAGDDELVLEDADEQYEVELHASRTGELLVIWSANRDTSEAWVLDAADPTSAPRSVGGRRRGVEYLAEHLKHPDGSDELLIVTNDDASEFRLARCPVPRSGDQDSSTWVPVRPENPAERLEQADAFAGHVVLTSRTEGRNQLRILRLDDVAGEGIVVRPVSDIASLVAPEEKNVEHDVDRIIVVDESYLMPQVWSELDLATGERTELLRKDAPGFDPAAYVGEKRSFDSADGTPSRPRSCGTATRPSTAPRRACSTPTAPTSRSSPTRSGTRRSRACSIAASSTFTPMSAVAARVAGGGGSTAGWSTSSTRSTTTSRSRTGSARPVSSTAPGSPPAACPPGGLLQGAVFSQRPDRWRAVVAEVPFVDVLTTMLDPTIPLTVNEWDEWGDPSRPDDYAWMARYSPYDNLPPAGGRPDLLVTGAVHDARVMVWEPAKWAAALRETDPEWGPRCLFRVETGAGAHVGPAGRFAHLAYEAEVYAWMLDRLGVATTERSTTDSRISNG